MFLLLISFIAGILTVLAPCTIALLPVIVGGTVAEGRDHFSALRVTASLGVSVVLFTLLLKTSTLFINVPQSFWEILSGAIISVIGLIMIFPQIWESLPFVSKLNLNSNKMLAEGYKKKGAAGDIIMGAALGPVFSSCSPTYFLILATILPKSISQGIIYLLVYAIGMCGFLLVITILSQKAVGKLGLVLDDRGWLKRSIGVIFLLLGLAILFGLENNLELFVSNHIFDVTKIEQNLLTKQAGQTSAQNNLLHNSLPVNSPVNPAGSAVSIKGLTTAERTKLKSQLYPKAPEIADPSGFINTDGQPITLSSFVGKKVVLVDFWTYSCINCQRTLPYLNAWYKKYADEGLEIIGIHTPEFSFEKVESNVAAAVKSDGIEYPVVMDNDYGTWNAFQNSFWPREYLIDIDGFIVHDHTGEGDYDGTEQAIQKALAERASILGAGQVSKGTVAPADAVSMNPNQVNSPETYFGAGRNEFLANGTQSALGEQNLTLPQNISLNKLYLSGTWNFNSEYAETKDATAKIIYEYDAKNLYMVASGNPTATLKILLDGKPVPAVDRGADVNADSAISVSGNRLYEIIAGQNYGEHTLEIDVTSGTLDAYTFTFG